MLTEAEKRTREAMQGGYALGCPALELTGRPRTEEQTPKLESGGVWVHATGNFRS